jgi:ligand-binding sensor domain-containing protein
MKQVYAFTLSLIFFAACNAQVNKLPEENSTKTSSVGTTKLVKTQGTNQYANVHCGLMDKAGNLWFGTTGEGVYRYNGKSFTNFTEKDGLSSNHVWCLYEDKNGELWFGTANGVSRYDGKAFSNISISVINGSNHFAYNSGTQKVKTDVYGNPSEEKAVWSIMQDKNGKFWFGTTNGIYRYDGIFYSHFPHNDGVKNNTGIPINKVESILEDKSGNVWFGGRGTEGLFCFDGKDLKNFKPDGKNWAWPVLEDKTGNIWFCNRGHSVYRYDGISFTNFADDKLTGWVVSMVEDEAGNLWFSTEKGLARFDGKQIKILTSKDGLGNEDIFCLTLDRSGNLWVGTRGMGLYKYDGKTFTGFTE